MEFARRMYGYEPKQVDEYVESMKADYEEELDKKKDRLTELVNENRSMRLRIEELERELEVCKEREESVGQAMIKAEEAARATVMEAERKKDAEIEKISFEVKRWEERGDEVRRQLIAFEEELMDMLEKYQSEVNYLASKDVKKTYFGKDSHLPQSDKTA